MNARLALATRSAHKAEEIARILPAGLRIASLDALAVPESPEEDAVEAFDTFRENALAKARHFARLTGLPTLADDSGLVVPALRGAPGVFSKRFAALAAEAGDPDAAGLPDSGTDARNNALLARRIRDVPLDRRGAYYVCAAALVRPDGPAVVSLGTCHGAILERPRGAGGFGYDPLFLLPDLGLTFGEAPAAEKDRRSHRARAFRALAAAAAALLRD